MSRHRARCPRCRTLTAVPIGETYECHACGRVFAAGLVRVPRAWGKRGEPLAEAARLPLDYPEVAVIDEPTLAAQTLALAGELPARPLVLGGCCCAHVGAVEGLARRDGRLAVIWVDAHGDLNTPQTSRSGNEWGMPLRMLLDAGTIAVSDVVLVGARSLDPPEAEFIEASGLATGREAIEEVLASADRAYVAVDCDVLDPGEGIAVFVPEPQGLSLVELEEILRATVARTPLAGAGLTGLVADDASLASLGRICSALGL